MRAAFYKATRPGLPGIYNRLVRWWERGPHSHCELIFSDGMAASASFLDGGVRFKEIQFDPDHWDFVELPDHLEATAREWFKEHEFEEYDVMGNVHFIASIIPDDDDKWSCAESIAAALGFTGAWRFEPNVLFAVLARLQPH
jgi:hypothetical protein